MIKTLLISLLIAIALASTKPNPVDIPAVTKIYPHPWYSGYLDIEDGKTHMHYFFFPSQNDPANDPLLFWFNGGPGCSSLLGAMYEHGPFLVVDSFASLVYNPFSWNQRASTVYIESPAQVGFSYMDSKAPTWNDDMVAKLNAKAIREFLRVWQDYKNHPTYISGESYGGIYVPTVFYELHSTNQQSDVKVNLKGFAVGNGCTDPSECEFLNDYSPYLMQMVRNFGYITDEEYKQVDAKCGKAQKVLPKQCEDLLDKVDKLIDGYNIYDAFRPCYANNNDANGERLSFKEMRRQALRIKRKPTDKLTWAPPCVDSVGIDLLLKDPDNRRALGIPAGVPEYSMCNADDDFGYDRSQTGSYWVYQKLVPLNKYKITIYSGDADPAVPYAGTIAWMWKIKQELGLTTEEYWRPWYTKAEAGTQNSGSIWTLGNQLKLVSFKGIGHMAPQWNYEGGYKMINNLINGDQI